MYKLRIYNKFGKLIVEEFYVTRQQAVSRYYDLIAVISTEPSIWVKNGDNWERIMGF